MISYSTNIPVSIDVVWKHFLDKIEHPENFVPGVSNVVIKEKNKVYVLRQMDVQPPTGAKISLVEKITHEPFSVRYLIVEHPIYMGYVDNIAEQVSEKETKITFSLVWKNKETGLLFDNQEIITNAVLKTADFILNK